MVQAGKIKTKKAPRVPKSRVKDTPVKSPVIDMEGWEGGLDIP